MSKRTEERLAGTGRAVRDSDPETAQRELLRQISARLDPVALGASLAVVCGSMLLLATTVLVLKGGQQVGTHLGLLSQYLPGYRVTPGGSVVGALYASAGGFLLGWFSAHLRNAFLRMYLWMVRFWADLSHAYFLDRLD
ncbi:MAG: FAD-binding protein [Chloroflexi bacterium]|nr:FAD-binding protein [Chloroflexota bacterium]